MASSWCLGSLVCRQRRCELVVGQPVARQRADVLVAMRGLAADVVQAQALILAGLVYSGTQRIAKAGDQLGLDAPLEVRGKPHPWASRGGLKLDHALTHFGWDVAGAVAVDIGASTGGFTDVLLSRGATQVYAVDVGHGQLAWRLQTDPRVVILDKTNARTLTAAQISTAPDVIVCDASFTSLTSVLPAALGLAAPAARLLALIKPQFEVHRSELGDGGVVRDAALHARVCAEISSWLGTVLGWHVHGLCQSPITGPQGNIEFIIAATRLAA